MSDRIEKQVVLRAPVERVWRAISDSSEFGRWFGVDFGGVAFAAGKAMKARIAPTTVDAEIAKMQEPHVGVVFEISVDRIEPTRLFSFRWHPFGVDKTADYSKEPTTLVVFQLEEVAGGTKLTITESGFDQIPLERRAQAFAANEGGWTAQAKLIEKYVAS
jgi:uncharacterized protein YndB with AHSA1/START domain